MSRFIGVYFNNRTGDWNFRVRKHRPTDIYKPKRTSALELSKYGDWTYGIKDRSNIGTIFTSRGHKNEISAAMCRDALLKGGRADAQVPLFDPNDPDNIKNFTDNQFAKLKELAGADSDYTVNMELEYNEEVEKILSDFTKPALPVRIVPGAKEEDVQLAEEAFLEVKKIFIEYAQNAYLEAANYIVDTFFDLNTEYFEVSKQRLKVKGEDKGPILKVETVIRGPAPDKEISYYQFINRLQQADSEAPSKSWMYNALGLYFDNRDIKEETPEVFHTYGNLPVSHQIKLLTVKNAKKKAELIKEIDKEKLTVKQLQVRVYEVRGIERKQPALGLVNVMTSTKILLENKLKQIEALIETDEHKKNKDLGKIKKNIEKLAGEIDVLIREG